MDQNAKAIDETAQMMKLRIRSRIIDFNSFCMDSLEDGMGEDIADDIFLKVAMNAYLNVCAVNAEE